MGKKKVLFVATVVRMHINLFHNPYMEWFQEQGWQVDVAANNDYENPKDCYIPNCDNFYCLPFERSPFKINNLRTYFLLKKIINENNYDIIHCHTPMGSVIARLAALNSRKKGTKVIYTAHGFHFYKGAPFINWILYYPIERLLSFKTDILITINREDYYRAKKFHMKRLEYVHGVGLDLNKFKVSNNKAEVRKSLGLQDSDIFAISVAQLIKRKNHIVLIEAVKKLNNPYFHLFICGDGVQYDYLDKKIHEFDLENQVHLLGFRKDIYKLCSNADLFMLASLQEGLPVAVMEAMACGLPIICSNIRGNDELIDVGKGGFLNSPDDVDGFVDSIQTCLDYKFDEESMKSHNLTKIKNYSLPVVLKEVTDIYYSIMK